MPVDIPDLALVLVVVSWLYLYWAGVRGLAPVLAPLESSHAVVTAYVPARNEANVLGAAIESLLAQGSVLSRLIVTDDASTDTTSEVIARFASDTRVVALKSGGPGPGERGKPAALCFALEHSAPETEWLLFADADVVLEPGAIGALLDHAQKTGADLVSVFPKIELGSFLEELVMPSIGALVLRAFPPARVADPDSKLAFANGQVILVRREVYTRAGGHRAVIGEILEDVRLAQKVKAAGGKLALADGRRIARTRMYEAWSELVEGWAKNLYLLLGARAFLWIPLLPLVAASGWIAALCAGLPFGPIGALFVLGLQADLRRRGGAKPIFALFAPIGASLASGILALSTFRHVLGRPIPWKGRDYV